MLIIVDTKREATAVKEANTLEIPVMALADTNANPDEIDYIIPGNDDAVRAIKLIMGALADAVIEGEQMRKAADFNEDGAEADANFSAYAEEDADDETLLGASTLAKLRNAKLFEEEEE
jgi:small subunit ribosomal protein S2